MAESPDGKGVLLFGGKSSSNDGRGVLPFGGTNSENDYEGRIFELPTGANSWNFLEWNWNILDINLKHKRKYHTVIPLQ